MDVGGAETELARAGANLDALRAVNFLELRSDFLGPIWRAIIDDYKLPLKIATCQSVQAFNVVPRNRCASY